jgi:integrase
MLDPAWLEPAIAPEGSRSPGRSNSTLRAYRSDWADFTAWCRNAGKEPLPASTATLALYLRERASLLKISTLARRVSAISRTHAMAGYDSPAELSVVRKLMVEFRLANGSAPAAKKPMLVDDLRAISSELPNTMLGLRDRAILLLGFTGGLRRSELVAIDYADLDHDRLGLAILVRSATAQEKFRQVAIPHGSRRDGTCPVAALNEWLKRSAITTGPVFRVINRYGRVLEKRLSGEAVGLVVKRWVGRLGYDPSEFGAHSLRAGLATSAAIAGKSESAIMRQTGHRSIASIRRYLPANRSERENAAEGLGL